MSKERTYGEKLVGIDFNPANSDQVHQLKETYAHLIDGLNNDRENSDDPEVKRMISVAITELQTSQMWAVKAVTWEK